MACYYSFVWGYFYVICRFNISCFRIDKHEYFGALRTAICFPNIVAIPILLIPSLCEYEVFHEFDEMVEVDNEKESFEYKMVTCEADVNAVVFTYFFGFFPFLEFWSPYAEK